MLMKFTSKNGREYSIKSEYRPENCGYYKVELNLGGHLKKYEIDIPIDESKIIWEPFFSNIGYKYIQDGEEERIHIEEWLFEQNYLRNLRMKGKTARLDLTTKSGKIYHFQYECIRDSYNCTLVTGLIVRNDGSIVPRERFVMYFCRDMETGKLALSSLEYEHGELGFIEDKNWLRDNFPESEIQKLEKFINDNFEGFFEKESGIYPPREPWQ